MALSSSLTAHACFHADTRSEVHAADKQHFSKNDKVVKVRIPVSLAGPLPAYYDPRWEQLPSVGGVDHPPSFDLGAELNRIRASFPQLRERRGFNVLANGQKREKWVKVKAETEALERETVSFETFQTDFMRKHFEEKDYRSLVAAGSSVLEKITGMRVIGNNLHFDTSHDHADFYVSRYDPENGHRLEIKGQRLTDGAAVNVRRHMMGLPVPGNFDRQRQHQAARADGDEDLAAWNAFVGGAMDLWIHDWAGSHGLEDEYEQGRQREARLIQRKLDLEGGALKVAELVEELARKDRYIQLLEQEAKDSKARESKLCARLKEAAPEPRFTMSFKAPQGREQSALEPTK